MASSTTCTRQGCTRPRLARGLCRSCYNVAHRRGDFAVPAYARRTSGFVCPSEHSHGAKQTCYDEHRCTCEECYSAQSARRRQRHRDRFYGRNEPALVSARGVHRRIQALHARGWSFTDLSLRLGQSRGAVRYLLTHSQVTPATHERVAALFTELATVAPPEETPQQRHVARLARRRAAAQGWSPPFAWDDIDQDEAPAIADEEVAVDEVAVQLAIAGEPVVLSPAERRVAVREMNAAGRADGAIAATLSCHIRTVERIREDLGLPAAVGFDRERIVA